MNMMSKLIFAILQMSTVNFAKLALVINSQVKVCSNLKYTSPNKSSSPLQELT